MSRPGVTYHDVANAALALSAQGKNPTIGNIRVLTGTGSNSTIALHLRDWKEKQEKTKSFCAKDNLPEEIILTMQGLWERVLTQAEERVDAFKQDYEQTIADLSEKHSTLENDNHRWQRQHHDLSQEKKGLEADKAALEVLLRKHENEIIEFTVKHENANQQLQEKQERIEELQRLNLQVQANLEHYHEASREQRVREQQRYEQAQNQSEQAIQQLQQDVRSLNQQLQSSLKECEQLRETKSAMLNQYDQLSTQAESLKSSLDQALNEVIQHTNAEQHWLSQYQKIQEKADERYTELASLQAQLGIMTQKFSDAQHELSEQKEQNKFLTNERWILNQENSQLVGQLKQFEKFGIAIKHSQQKT